MASNLYEILNDVWDSANHGLKMVLNYVHTHAADGGGQLDWDIVWSDAVHSHGSDAEGGTLDWDSVWSDAVHAHSSNAEGGTVAHSALTGLTSGDDHTQYQLKSLLTTQADTIYATAASAWARLPKGTGTQKLQMNSGATAPEWVTGSFVPSGGIIIWTGTIANIPSGYVICDGNNSSPNLLTRFLEGVASAATEPGTTGGATSKTTAGHTHTQGATGAMADPGYYQTDNTGGSAVSVHSGVNGHTHTNPTTASNTDGIADIRPLFYDVAYIMKT